jgi:hypothetical protein
MKFNKKDIDKVKDMTKEEVEKLQEDYEMLVKGVRKMSTGGLVLLSVVGILVILFFQSNLIDFIGLLVFVYPFYVFAQREGHQGGFFDGYYQVLKGGKKTDNKK